MSHMDCAHDRTTDGATLPFDGCCSRECDPNSHGGYAVIETCAYCGATRRANRNGGCTEHGPWQPAVRERRINADVSIIHEGREYQAVVKEDRVWIYRGLDLIAAGWMRPSIDAVNTVGGSAEASHAIYAALNAAIWATLPRETRR